MLRKTIAVTLAVFMLPGMNVSVFSQEQGKVPVVLNKGNSSVQVYINEELAGGIDPDNPAPHKDLDSAKNALIEEYLKKNPNVNSKTMRVKTITRGSGNTNTQIESNSSGSLNPFTMESMGPRTTSAKIQINGGEWSDIDPNTYHLSHEDIAGKIINQSAVKETIDSFIDNGTRTPPGTRPQEAFTWGKYGVYIGNLLQPGEAEIPINMSPWAAGYVKTAVLNGFGNRFENGYSFTDYRKILNKADLAYLLARALFAAKPGFDSKDIKKHAFNDAVQDIYSRTIYIDGEAHGVEEIVHSLNILKGDSDKNFGGKLPVSRWQLAFSTVMTLLSAGNSIEPSSLAILDRFTDVADLSEEVKKVIAFVVENGYMEGTGASVFLPFSEAALEQGVRAAVRAFEATVGDGKIVRPIEITSPSEGALLSGNVLLTWQDPNRIDGASAVVKNDKRVYLNDEPGLLGAREDFFGKAINDFFENRSSFTRNMATRYTVTVYSDGRSVFRNETTELKQEIPADIINAGTRLQITVSSNDTPYGATTMAKTSAVNCFAPGAFFNRATRSGDKVTLYWRPVEGAARYEADLAWARTDEEKLRNAFKTIAIEGRATSLSFDYAHNTVYDVKLRAYGAAGAQLPQTDGITLYQGLGRAQVDIELSHLKTKEEVEANLKSISVPVWRMDGKGHKTSSRANIQIHKDIAGIVAKIFDEIYNGPEQFPIKDVGGYSWRGDDSNSRHKYGLAIDINSNENYMPSRNVGSYWRPYDDPFSITPDGDVVKAFEKYGFAWGSGDAMHFEYDGYMIHAH